MIILGIVGAIVKFEVKNLDNMDKGILTVNVPAKQKNGGFTQMPTDVTIYAPGLIDKVAKMPIGTLVAGNGTVKVWDKKTQSGTAYKQNELVCWRIEEIPQDSGGATYGNDFFPS